MHLQRLAHNGHSVNVNWMNKLITLTLNSDLCDLWEVVHLLNPSALPPTNAAAAWTAMPQGSAVSQPDPSTAPMSAIIMERLWDFTWCCPTGTEKKKSNKTVSLPQCFIICLLASSLLLASPPSLPSLFHAQRHTCTPQVSFRAGVQSLLLSEIHYALATWQSLQTAQWVFYSQH